MGRISSLPTHWNAGLWPYRPRPLQDELLSSYITRAAHGLGLKPISLLNAALGSRQSLLAQDLDNYANVQIVDRISGATGLDAAAVEGMTLAGYVDSVLTTYFPKGRKPWLMPVTVCANDRLRPGLQFCPDCFETDAQPYLRRAWRLAFITCCTIHSIALLDRCPGCEAHVQVHRSISIRYCYNCNSDLAAAPKISVPDEAILQQLMFENAVINGWTTLGGRKIYSNLYFLVVRQIASLLVNGPRSSQFRAAVGKSVESADRAFQKPTTRQPIEYLETSDRLRLMIMVASVMSDFPRRFVAICRTAGHSRSHIIKDMPYVPFAFDEVLREHLDLSPYYPSEVEVAAAAAWLRRTRGVATYRTLKNMFGESRSLLYRHMDYERLPARPSWRRSKASEETRRASN